MNSDENSNHFDEYYYSAGCGRPYRRTTEWLDFFDGIAERIVREIAPKSVLDVGCAMGFLVEAFRDRGVEAFGIDISEYAISKVREDIQPYCKVASIAEPLEDEFDLIVTIETFEHLPHKEVINAIGNLVHASEDIIFSSSPADFVEATHQNVQPPEYWALNFAQYGYFRDVDYDSTFITDWTVRFRKGRDPLSRIVADYERMLWRLVQQSRSEREQILQQRQLLSNSASALEMLQNKMKSIVSDVNHHSTEALVSQLEELMGKIDELDLTKDKGRQSDSVPDL